MHGWTDNYTGYDIDFAVSVILINLYSTDFPGGGGRGEELEARSGLGSGLASGQELGKDASKSSARSFRAAFATSSLAATATGRNCPHRLRAFGPTRGRPAARGISAALASVTFP